MAPCNPNDLTINVPPGASGPSIPGFGQPFAPKIPDFTLPLADGFPEDLLEILDLLQFILPSGTIKPSLSLNFGKDIFDGIMNLLDKFLPFLMLYKFFLPILDLIICIIEVLCAIPNPFKLIKALRRLFRVCLPAFLALFPIFALIVMLLSLLFLILALIEYIIAQVIKLVNILLKNIRTISKALTKADSPSILAAVKKIGLLLCGFQNLFVILAIFTVIIDVIKDMLKLAFAIPPCDDGDNGNAEKCCTPDVCPSFIKNNDGMERTTGTLQYFNEVAQDANLTSVIPTLPAGFYTSIVRSESWQFYDAAASIPDAFWNITNAFDLPTGVSQVFFPTDSTYQAGTPTNQVPYLVDLRLFYNPATWGRTDPLGARFVRVKNCIVLKAPTQNLNNYNNSTTTITNGVLQITGGTVTEDNGLTEVVVGDSNATLNNLIHKPDSVVIGTPVLSASDGYNFTNIDYTFHINYEVLIQKALITLGCIPIVAIDRTFVNSVFGGNAGANFTLLNEILNGANGNTFPDVAAAQQCLTTALTALRNNISESGAADFQATTTICLTKLGADTTSAINSLIGIGFDPYKSTLSLDPQVQFTSKNIAVTVMLNETSGQNIATNVPAAVAVNLANRLSATATFGTITPFVYDGYTQFNASISSVSSGSGTLQVSFDNKIISTASVPADLSQPPVITPVVLDYTFVYSPVTSFGSDGAPVRDDGDVSRDSGSNDNRG